ncbi:MAG: hypothetical protein JWL68_5168 [Actinomycetia bacterium]|nr:hypothetical protein [Actinomycetes bacterium]
MNHFRRIFAAVATLAGAVLTFAAAPAAFAMRVPPPGEGSGIAPPPPPVRVIAEGGMPGWQIILIALAAALVAATTAVLLDHARAARKIHAPAA